MSAFHDIRLHKGQSLIFNDLFVKCEVTNAVGVCSRGFGKSHLAAACAVKAADELMSLDISVPNKNIYITAPSYSQVTDIYHPMLVYQLGLGSYAISHSKDTGRIILPRNVEIRLMSYEALDRIRGTGCYFAANDEVRDWTKGEGFRKAWEGIVQPCLTTRWSRKRAKYYGAPSHGRSLTISTPRGYDELYDMYNMQEKDPANYRSYHFDYTKSPLLDAEELERVRHTIDPLTWAREYKASFEESGNNVFYCFDRKIHVRNDIEPFRVGGTDLNTGTFTLGEDVHIGIDFNVGLQCSSAFAIRGSQMQFIDEFQGSPDTETLALSIQTKYWPNYKIIGHPDFGKKICNIHVYPDPTGRARKTSAPVGITDIYILQDHGFEVRAHSSSPPIVDSVAAVNRKLMTAAGEVSMFVSANCTGTIKSLERTSWVDGNPNTATIDKSQNLEHFSDGIRYSTHYLFPIHSSGGTTRRSRNF